MKYVMQVQPRVPLGMTPPPSHQNVTVQRYRGVGDTVKYMRKFVLEGQAHPAVRAYAVEVIRQVEPKDYLSEAAAIYYDVCRTVRYTRDPANREFVHHPAVVLAMRAGDCDDSAILIRAAMAASAASTGSPVEFVVAGFDKKAKLSQRYTHVFIRVWDDRTGQWVVLDPVAGPHTGVMLSKVQHFKSYET